MSSRQKRPQISAEERAARALKARRRFRAVIRLVMANLFWLGDIEDTLGDNALLNIQKLTRKKVKKSTLTTKEKLILTKPKEERTDEEKHLLNRSIGGLKCFRRYPPEVKSQLAAVTYFVYIGPSRVIVKQDHAPSAMYFLLSGEASVTVRTYDKMLSEWVESEHGTVGPGTMFGEIALLHGIARTATITTTVPCELLMIKRNDFDIVLKETVWKAWEHITKIMNRFSYFKNWDAVTKRECSIISRTKTYAPEEVILGDDIGLQNYSYLIVKGNCEIIEHLMMYTFCKNGKKVYKLYKPEDGKDTTVEEEIAMTKIFKKYLGKDYEKSRRSTTSNIIKESKYSIAFKPNVSSRFSELMASKTSEHVSSLYDINLETRFIKVGEITDGAVFNIGENFQRRRVVAHTSTMCLLIPRYWLIKMNKDNIWSRVQQYLNKTIPNTDQIFKDFIEQQKFLRYRKNLVKDILDQKRVSNNNTIHNVPYSIRLKDAVGDDYLNC